MIQTGLKQLVYISGKPWECSFPCSPLVCSILETQVTADTLVHPAALSQPHRELIQVQHLRHSTPRHCGVWVPAIQNASCYCSVMICSWQVNSTSGQQRFGCQRVFLESSHKPKIAKRCVEPSTANPHTGIKLSSFWPIGTQVKARFDGAFSNLV